jgi:hypothetical protein
MTNSTNENKIKTAWNVFQGIMSDLKQKRRALLSKSKVKADEDKKTGIRSTISNL